MTHNEWQELLEKRNRELCMNHPEADPNVLQFITELTCCATTNEDQWEIIRSTFMAGYCYHFAHMLKHAFKRGEVCIAAPFGHCVWVDENGTAYDAEGMNFGEQVYNIPESYLGDAIKDFTHIPGEMVPPLTQKDIVGIIRKYEADNGLPKADLSYYHIE